MHAFEMHDFNNKLFDFIINYKEDELYYSV